MRLLPCLAPAVHHAAAHGMTTLVEVLVEHGANLTIVNAVSATRR